MMILLLLFAEGRENTRSLIRNAIVGWTETSKLSSKGSHFSVMNWDFVKGIDTSWKTLQYNVGFWVVKTKRETFKKISWYFEEVGKKGTKEKLWYPQGWGDIF